MTVRVDTREGSKDYIEPLRRAGVPVEPVILAAGDFEIMGRGPEGRPVPVGIEVKQWDDVMACVRSGRFAEQLRGMRASYEVSWLLIEGRIKADGKGVSIRRGEKWYTPPGRMSYQELTSWLLTMCSAGGVLLWRTETKAESVEWLRAQYWWWKSKDFEAHRAHLDFYLPPLVGTAPWAEPLPVAVVARTFPNIGATMAQRAAEHFASVEEMILADAERWMQIDGVGAKTAEAVRRYIRKRSR